MVHTTVSRKAKAVVSADPVDLARVEGLVKIGRYPSVSAFVRDAVSEKLAKLAEERVAEQVAQYCAVEDQADDDLIAAQAFERDSRPRGKR